MIVIDSIVETAKIYIIKYLQAGYNRNSDEMAEHKKPIVIES